MDVMRELDLLWAMSAVEKGVYAAHDRLAQTVAALSHGDEPPPGVRVFAAGPSTIGAGFRKLEARTRRSFWNAQRRPRFNSRAVSWDLDERSRARGIEMCFVVSRVALDEHPLLTSLYPYVRVGPVPGPLLVVDDCVALFAGPPAMSGANTILMATHGEVLASAFALRDAIDAASVPAIGAGEDPPVAEREVLVARYLCLGMTDVAIGHKLGISPRTVERAMAHLATYLGATCRADLVARVTGEGWDADPDLAV